MCNASARSLLGHDRARVTPGIVHLGTGAFHRAHAAVHVDDLLKTDPSWGIIGASLRRADTRDALAPQDFLYTLVVRSGSESSHRVIGSLLDVLDATHQHEELLAAMADPRIRIVSLTVTEKGYCHDPASGELDEDHPDIVHDLADMASPASAPGYIVRALELRRQAGIAPFTVMSCDNLPANGRTAARIVARLAALHDEGLGEHVARDVAFPSTMVDRIVPATTDADRARVLAETGLADAWPVVTEPFSQWVIEDRFPAGRPALETVGARFVPDVEPFELMKLRLLNGSHSTLAYLGYLAGYAFVSETMADPAFHALVERLMRDEVMDTLPRELGGLDDYREALLARFANPALRHRTWQIAMDGSQKLPQRLLGTIRDRLAAGRPVELCALGVAAWIRYACGHDEQGGRIDVRDPLAGRLGEIAAKAGDDAGRLVDGFLGIEEVFGRDLPRNAVLRAALGKHLDSLLRRGARKTVQSVVNA
ncbi:MAG: mannitol dehydrogenase family protein [Pseudomonadota bacterium]|nr:mannitol dehydrogenase family protein [Pseudomonadota bacterium]